MTDRINSFLVVLDRDIREDDAEYVINYIRMIRHVADVSPNVTDRHDLVSRSQLRHECQQKLWDAVREVFEGKEG